MTENLICPCCNSELIYNKTNDTHIWSCEECPVILIEWYDSQSTKDLIKFNSGINDEEKIEQDYEEYYEEIKEEK